MFVNHSLWHRRSLRREVSVGAVVAQVTIPGLLVILGLAALSGVLARDVGEELSARSFERLAVVSAASLAPSINAARTRNPGAAAHLDRRVADMVAAGPLADVSVIEASGRVLWSRRAGEAGRLRPLPPAAHRALATDRVASTLEAAGEDDRTGPLLVAYVGIHDVHGTPVLVSLTERRGDATDFARKVWSSLTPAAIAALLVLALALLPLVRRLAVDLRRVQRENTALRTKLLEASEGERRRVAAELHDTVIPVLTGAALDLDLARRRAGRNGDGSGRVPTDTATSVRRAIDDLRGLVSGSRAAPTPMCDLATLLRDLADEQERAGVSVSLLVSGTADLPEAVSALLHRCAREALRNVATHSRATSVLLSVERSDGEVSMVVDDDGSGFDAERLAQRQGAGHLGLQTLADQVVEGGGSITASSSPGHGTRLVVTVPVDGSEADAGGAS